MAVLAPALARLRTEINHRWPARDRGSDGWIGDKAHQKSKSDHNPNGRGVVNALDIDVDGIDVPTLVSLLIRHPAVNYVIWNRRIWSRSHGFGARSYTGSNPHTSHVHVSLLQSSSAENNGQGWNVSSVVVVPIVGPPTEGTWAERLYRSMPQLKQGVSNRASVRKVQALLNVHLGGADLSVDGGFGPNTNSAVRRFQQARGLGVDGVVGPRTWGALGGGLATLRRGANGTAVGCVQALLNVQGARIKTDRDFGPATAAAVGNVQTKFGLTSDQVVGPVTWTALLTR
jgi:hypothetical protein